MVLTVAIGYLIVWAGNLEPPAAPVDTMVTLDDIYHRLDKDAGAPPDWGLDPSASPVSTMHTLQEIYDITPDFRGNSGTAVVGDVCNSATFYKDSATKLTGERTACFEEYTGGFPDTGQTTSYTTTYGEDHDYTSANSPATCDPSFTNNLDGTVTDHCTGLMWQQATGSTMDWETALTFCEGATTADYTDWRLPNIKELQSIVNYETYSPAAFSEFSTASDYYWSSTTYAGYSDFACYVAFANGLVDAGGKPASVYVRCVRG